MPDSNPELRDWKVSLKQKSLTRRMFKYPCSYLVYSPSFSALPKELTEQRRKMM
jgi:hypothetical protein